MNFNAKLIHGSLELSSKSFAFLGISKIHGGKILNWPNQSSCYSDSEGLILRVEVKFSIRSGNILLLSKRTKYYLLFWEIRKFLNILIQYCQGIGIFREALMRIV